MTIVKYVKSPSVIPTEKNIAEASPLEVEIERSARVPGPGVTAKTNRVNPRTKKIFISIISYLEGKKAFSFKSIKTNKADTAKIIPIIFFKFSAS